MVVPETVIDKARTMLTEAKRPIFLHDDDCDGTTSFVICYQFCGKEGKGIPIKRSPTVTPEFARYVKEFEPDLVVILDKPRVSAEFLEQITSPVLWIDHHEPQEVAKLFNNVLYLNPRLWNDGDNRPTSYWSYTITNTNLWIATVGSIGDWYLPEYLKEFKETYPDLVPEKYKRVEDLYLDTPIATLIRVIQFNIKGLTADAKKSVLTLTRVESPYEILKQTTARGKFLWRKYEKLAKDYNTMLEQAQEAAKQEGKLLVYIYTDDSMTFTGELSNELLIRYPERVIIVGRHHDGMYKCSLRSASIEIDKILAEALKGLDGYGGGHKLAVGCSVNEKDWETFLERFRKLIEKN